MTQLQRRDRLADVTIVGVASLWALLWSATPTMLGNHPQPEVHDEYAYLLSADTFAHGRLTNPPHPMWRHFETFHEIFQPTYSSKFPPGQGMVLALGQLLGDPLYGTWLSVAAGCGAMAWALRAWLSRPWSLTMAMIAGCMPTVHWWSQTYWGAGLLILGGSLFVGACVRAMVKPRASLGVIAGIGAGIMGLSRPFEGLLICAIVAVMLAVVWTRRRAWSVSFLLAAACPIALSIAFQLYYNWRVTGDALLMPFVLHANRYMPAPQFFWQHPRDITGSIHPHIQWFHAILEYDEYAQQTGSVSNRITGAFRQLAYLAGYVRPVTLVVLILGALLALRQKRIWFAWSIVLLMPTLHILVSPWMRSQYMAPALVCWLAILGVGASYLWRWHFHRYRVGAIVLAYLAPLYGWQCLSYARDLNHNVGTGIGAARAAFVQNLINTPGDDLVLIDFPPDDPVNLYSTPADWVFNGADIDRQPVIFAHWMSDAENQELMSYYPNRAVWYVRFGQGAQLIRQAQGGGR